MLHRIIPAGDPNLFTILLTVLILFLSVLPFHTLCPLYQWIRQCACGKKHAGLPWACFAVLAAAEEEVTWCCSGECHASMFIRAAT